MATDEVVLHGTIRLDSTIRSENVHFHDSFWREQTLAARKLFLSLTRIDFAVAVSSRAVHVFPALSRTSLIRDLFSYGFPRKLREGPYGSNDNVLFEMLCTVCVQVNSGKIFVHQLGLVREPVWAWMRQCCPSFTDLSANAVFSDILQVKTFGELTFDLKSLFLIQRTNHSSLQMWLSVLYITHQHIHQNSFKKFCFRSYPAEHQ